MTEDHYILLRYVGGKIAGGDMFSLYLRDKTSDYLTVSWYGTVIDGALARRGWRLELSASTHERRELTLAQGEAAIMVARSTSSHKAWSRYAGRLMTGELS